MQLATPLVEALRSTQVPVEGVDGLTVDAALLDEHGDLLTSEALDVLVAVARRVLPGLRTVLGRRITDRATLDRWTREIADDGDWLDPDTATVVGRADADGRVLVGPSGRTTTLRPVTLPDWLAGPAVTLFGPPDSAKMCLHAMNALHRVRADEPEIVARLVEQGGRLPRWGADSEDSKTPFVGDLLRATTNLAGCYAGTLELEDKGRHLTLADEGRSVPIKRIPGLPLPAGTVQLDGEPLPLHLLDLVLHVWANRERPEARVFYVPKLENEEEAAYLRELLVVTEEIVGSRTEGFEPGLSRVFLVFETPRAIFRIAEMAEALHPYFAGGSLGWHDFLAATARLFRYEPRYRIPVKADPNIVLHHIAESHRRLAEDLAPSGAIRIGGMYGVLFTDGDPGSFEVSMVGYVKDVVSQLRRGLDGFWVAHPDFVRVGLALVEAWERTRKDPSDPVLGELVEALVTDPDARAHLRAFLGSEDVGGLDRSHPLYPRALVAADMTTSTVIANDDPEEVRYNVFQALQYLASWLVGTGCVALPATLSDTRGEPVFVRVMDDLATTERSRWEVWAEVHHGRVSEEMLRRIVAEECAFLKEDAPSETKRVQVPWRGPYARWYPVAVALFEQLVLSDDPPEAVTELLLPFTFDVIRRADDPLAAARALCPGLYA